MTQPAFPIRAHPRTHLEREQCMYTRTLARTSTPPPTHTPIPLPRPSLLRVVPTVYDLMHWIGYI